MSIEVVDVRAVVWKIPIGKLWLNTERWTIVQNSRIGKIQPMV